MKILQRSKFISNFSTNTSIWDSAIVGNFLDETERNPVASKPIYET